MLRGIITDCCLLSQFISISQVVLVLHAHDSYLHALLDAANETTQTNTITNTLTLEDLHKAAHKAETFPKIKKTTGTQH